jgi:hypothetical protein
MKPRACSLASTPARVETSMRGVCARMSCLSDTCTLTIVAIDTISTLCEGTLTYIPLQISGNNKLIHSTVRNFGNAGPVLGARY